MKRISFLLAVAAVFVAACELAVDFDRTKIPQADSGTTTDATTSDSSIVADTGTDAPVDAVSDVASDVASDGDTDAALSDAGTDG